MNKQTEALKLALEQTLEMLSDNREYIEANERSEYLAMYDKAIAGAEKALAEQPAQQEPERLLQEIARLHDRIKDLESDVEFLSQPAPVQGGNWIGTVVDSGYGYKVIGFAVDTLADIPVGTRCYTTPQAQPAQREFVGLTDEEAESAIDEIPGFAFGLDDGNVSDGTVLRYARIVEAKLKEKNHE